MALTPADRSFKLDGRGLHVMHVDSYATDLHVTFSVTFSEASSDLGARASEARGVPSCRKVGAPSKRLMKIDWDSGSHSSFLRTQCLL